MNQVRDVPVVVDLHATATVIRILPGPKAGVANRGRRRLHPWGRILAGLRLTG